VWDGTGSPVVPNATIVVQNGRIRSVEADGPVPDGATEVDLSGSYVIPGLINTHGHVNGLWADVDASSEQDRLAADLTLYARYGVTTVNSLGDEPALMALRDASTGQEARARIYASGPVVADSDPGDAAATALANAEMGADWLKVRVDDNLGTGAKMPWDAVQAVLDVADENGIPLATHLFYLDDAKRLLEMGTGMIAHSVRDRPVDAEFMEALEESGICYVPTLTREVSTFAYADNPDFLSDPFFLSEAHPAQLAAVTDPDFVARMAESRAAAGYRVALAQAEENVKTLVDQGLPVAMGTDSGPNGRFPGYFEHLEMWMMVDAGITPEQALLSATSVAAGCLGDDEVGTLEPGRWADFLVLSDDPLADIRATRSLTGVYVAGSQLR
jgi:imidazolonepropionase-like amidohydrolase